MEDYGGQIHNATDSLYSTEKGKFALLKLGKGKIWEKREIIMSMCMFDLEVPKLLQRPMFDGIVNCKVKLDDREFHFTQSINSHVDHIPSTNRTDSSWRSGQDEITWFQTHIVRDK